MNPHEYLQDLKSTLQKKGAPETAEGQARYMRNQFKFYGLKSPQWTAISKAFFAEHGKFDGEELKQFARLCMEDEYREVNYIGLQMVEKQIKKQAEDFIEFLEELVRTRSWWDTVDWVSKLVGIHFRRYPNLIRPVTEHWMDSGNFWLQRICLIFQLTYKEKTDAELMFSYILRLADSKEFFIQKGAGWALRQYSKTNAKAVIDFIEKNPQLANLTKREGLKWLRKKRLLDKFRGK